MKRRGKANIFQKVNKRRLLFSLTAIIILFIFIYNIPGIYDFFMYSDYQEVEGLVGGSYMMERYYDDMLCYNNKEISRVSAKGEVKWNIPVSTTSPKLIVKDDYILLADLGGNNAYLYDEDKLKASIELKEEIFAAALDKSGNVALASKKQGYKGNIAVFDKHGEEQYDFSSGEGYISALDIRGGKIAVSQINAEDSGLYSKLILLDWKSNKEKLCANEKDKMVFDIRFQSGGSIIAVSDKDFAGYDRSGKERFKVSYGGRRLIKYNTESDDNMVFCFQGDRNNTVIESYSKRGRLRGTKSENGEIANLDVCKEAIVINTMRTVKRLDPKGRERSAEVMGHDVRGIKMFASRRHTFVTGNSQATVIRTKK